MRSGENWTLHDSNELFNVLCNFIDIQRHADGKTQWKIHMNHKRIASQNP